MGEWGVMGGRAAIPVAGLLFAEGVPERSRGGEFKGVEAGPSIAYRHPP